MHNISWVGFKLTRELHRVGIAKSYNSFLMKLLVQHVLSGT